MALIPPQTNTSQSESSSETMLRDSELILSGSRYRILKRLYRGTMGEIYLARQRGCSRFSRIVVIKTMRPEVAKVAQKRRWFQTEARLTGCVSHPNLVEVYDFFGTGRKWYIVMEYVKGVSLFTLQGEGLLFSNPHAAAYVTAETLDALHALNTRRDIKNITKPIIQKDACPQNVIVKADGSCKLCDLGVAYDEISLKNSKQPPLGSPHYRAPEIIPFDEDRQSLPLDPRIDVYCSGVMLFDLIAGYRPFNGPDYPAICEAILRAPLEDIAEKGYCDQEMMNLIRNALERNPEKRPATCAIFAEQLRSYIQASASDFTAKNLADLAAPFIKSPI